MKKTLSMMRQLVLQGSKDIEVRDAAIDAVYQFGGRTHDPLSQLRAIYNFVRDRIMFVNDPADVEWLQGPRNTLQVGAGDCDDRAVLLASMLRAIGLNADLKFRVIAANPANPRTFSHVYVVVRMFGKDIPLDPTYASNPFGIAPRGTRMGDFSI